MHLPLFCVSVPDFLLLAAIFQIMFAAILRYFAQLRLARRFLLSAAFPWGSCRPQTPPISRPGGLPGRHRYVYGYINMLIDQWIYLWIYQYVNRSIDISMDPLTY